MSEKVAIINAAGRGIGADAARRHSGDGYLVAIPSSSGKGELESAFTSCREIVHTD